MTVSSWVFLASSPAPWRRPLAIAAAGVALSCVLWKPCIYFYRYQWLTPAANAPFRVFGGYLRRLWIALTGGETRFWQAAAYRAAGAGYTADLLAGETVLLFVLGGDSAVGLFFALPVLQI